MTFILSINILYIINLLWLFQLSVYDHAYPQPRCHELFCLLTFYTLSIYSRFSSSRFKIMHIHNRDTMNYLLPVQEINLSKWGSTSLPIPPLIGSLQIQSGPFHGIVHVTIIPFAKETYAPAYGTTKMGQSQLLAVK